MRALTLLVLFSALTFLHGTEPIQFLKKELDLSTTPQEKMRIYNDLAWEYSYSNIDSATYFANKAFQIGLDYPDQFPNEFSNTLGTIGILYDINGQNKKALTYYLESLKIKEAINDSSGIASMRSNIGALYYTQNDFEKALPYFKESLAIEEAIGDTAGQIGSLINIGVILKNQNHLVFATKYTYRALELIKLTNNTDMLPLAYNNLGSQYIELNQLDSAEIYFNKALKTKTQFIYENAEAIAYENLARISLLKNQLKTALDYLYKSENISVENHIYENLSKTYQTYSEVYFALNDFDSAYYFKKQHTLLNDSLTNIENKQIMADIEATYNIEKKDSELQLKNKELAEKRKNETLFTYLIVLMALGLLLLILLISNFLRGNKKLKIKNQQIEQALNEKEILMREIHHRVKNNIQSIKSILNIQRRKSNNEETQNSLNETLNQINAMAVIHDRLYRNKNNVTEVDLNSYLYQLLKDILYSFDLKNEVQLDFQVESIPLDTDTILNFGLIFNELVTNSCKYGKNEDGVLELQILLQYQQDQIYFKIADKGKGSNDKQKGFGLDLVHALILKLKGNISIENKPGGYSTTINFPIE